MIHVVFDDQCLGTGAAQYQAQKSRLSIEPGENRISYLKIALKKQGLTQKRGLYKGQLSQSSFFLVTYFSEI